jgi:hypothetical protein
MKKLFSKNRLLIKNGRQTIHDSQQKPFDMSRDHGMSWWGRMKKSASSISEDHLS